MHKIAEVASVPCPALQQHAGFLRARGLDAPFLETGDLDGGVEKSLLVLDDASAH
jgi:hypothetical protein